MKILFVWCNQGSFGTKPIGISLLTAILEREGHECALFDTTFMDFGGSNYNDDLTDKGYFKPVEWPCDVSKREADLEEELTKKVNEFKPELICMSVLNDEIALAEKIIFYLQEITGYPILVGNKAASVMCKKPVEGVSYFFGESLNQINDVVRLGVKYHKYMHSSGYLQDLDSLPILDWTNFDERHFLKAYDGDEYRGGDHMIGWGCTNSCAYCINESWRELHGGMKGCIRRYGVDRITDELQTLTEMYGLDFWKFHDEDFLLKPLEYLDKLVVEYTLKVDLPFTCMTNAKSVTERKVEILKNMGCVSVSMGVETGDPVMRRMLNRREAPEDIIRAVKLLQDYGIRVSTFNMIGLPFEDEKTIQATIELNRAAGVKQPNISLFIPLEGTRLYDIAVRYKMYEPGTELRTDKPTLKLNSISEEKLMYYYNNFYHLVTKEWR